MKKCSGLTRGSEWSVQARQVLIFRQTCNFLPKSDFSHSPFAAQWFPVKSAPEYSFLPCKAYGKSQWEKGKIGDTNAFLFDTGRPWWEVSEKKRKWVTITRIFFFPFWQANSQISFLRPNSLIGKKSDKWPNNTSNLKWRFSCQGQCQPSKFCCWHNIYADQWKNGEIPAVKRKTQVQRENSYFPSCRSDPFERSQWWKVSPNLFFQRSRLFHWLLGKSLDERIIICLMKIKHPSHLQSSLLEGFFLLVPHGKSVQGSFKNQSSLLVRITGSFFIKQRITCFHNDWQRYPAKKSTITSFRRIDCNAVYLYMLATLLAQIFPWSFLGGWGCLPFLPFFLSLLVWPQP